MRTDDPGRARMDAADNNIILSTDSYKVCHWNLHRTWIDLRSAVSSGDAENILSECERGENAAEERYDKALKAELPASAASIVKKQHDRVRDARDQIKALKNRM